MLAPSIPVSQIVNITPQVLGAGGTGLSLTGLYLTASTRVPIGQIYSFASALAVSAFFGPASAEYTEALIYFNGFDGSDIKPAAILFTQYAWAAPVAAYLRSGPGLTLTEVKAITPGTITIAVDGLTHTSGSINLAGATSLSNAASLIQTALAAFDATVTASIGASFTGSGTGTNLAITSVTGYVSPGDVVSGAGVPANTTIVSQSSGSTGGAGTYVTSAVTTASTASLTSTSSTLSVSAVGGGTVTVGDTVTGSSVAAGTYITAAGTGTGATGTYILSGAQQSVASEAMTLGLVTVAYDSVSTSFVIQSGATGINSVIAYPTTNATATALLLTAATGAVLSQGAALSTPAAFMNEVVAQTTNWATFTHMFSASTADKEAFALWNNGQNDQFLYSMWDTDITVASPNATTSAGYIITQAGYSGTAPLYEPSNQGLASFLMGYAASIDYTQEQGRANAAFRSQSGLAAGVNNLTVAANVIANGYSYYGAYAARAQGFTFLYPGIVTGPFAWIDSYLDQIWLNSALQLAAMELLVSVKSLPYNTAGYGLIEAACADPINAGLFNGVIQTGVPLSAAQVAEVNAAAGKQIDGVLSTRGWYLLIQPAPPTVRGKRQSPPITFWYTDGESVQQINIASVTIL